MAKIFLTAVFLFLIVGGASAYVFINNKSVVQQPSITPAKNVDTEKNYDQFKERKKSAAKATMLSIPDLHIVMDMPSGFYQNKLKEIGNYDLKIIGTPDNYFRCWFVQGDGDTPSKWEPITQISSVTIRNGSNSSPAVYLKTYEYPSSPTEKEQYGLYIFKQNGFEPVTMSCTKGAELFPDQVNQIINNFTFVKEIPNIVEQIPL